jgi:hypothetical protein
MAELKLGPPKFKKFSNWDITGEWLTVCKQLFSMNGAS